MRSGLIAAMLVTVVLLIAAALIRVLAIPKFTFVPGPFQLFLEQMAAAAEHLGNTLGKAGRGIVRAVIALGRGLVSMVKGLASLPRKISPCRIRPPSAVCHAPRSRTFFSPSMLRMRGVSAVWNEPVTAVSAPSVCII